MPSDPEELLRSNFQVGIFVSVEGADAGMTFNVGINRGKALGKASKGLAGSGFPRYQKQHKIRYQSIKRRYERMHRHAERRAVCCVD